MQPSIVKLSNQILPYAWGSRYAIAELQRRPTPTREPEAELWIGDHPAAPSGVVTPSPAGASTASGDAPPAGSSTPLPDWIARDPEAILGRPGRAHLPFLAKILAAARPLSLQVHPGAEDAAVGFDREKRRGVGVNGRNYRDRNAKREMIIALSRFEALCGLRPDAEVVQLVGNSGSDSALGLLTRSIEDSEADRATCVAASLLKRLQDLSGAAREQLADELSLRSGARSDAPGSGKTHDEQHWVARLGAEHPGDPLALAPYFMNLLSLAPSEALVVQPGTIHSYLEGVAVELMTRSDNVVRAGLTGKPVDRREFQRIASSASEPPQTVLPVVDESGQGASYAAGIEEFDVAVLDVAPGGAIARRGGRVSVLLCIGGTVAVESIGASTVGLDSGEAALVPACIERYELRGCGGDPKLFAVSAGASSAIRARGDR